MPREGQVARRDLDRAFQVYAHRGNQEGYQEFLLCFFLHARDGGAVHVPVDVQADGQLVCGLVDTTDGLYYSVCTSREEVCRCQETASTITRLDSIIEMSLYDPEANGICINPGSSCPCFLPRAYILTALGLAVGDSGRV